MSVNLGFWLLCNILYQPALAAEIRGESEQAFTSGLANAPDISVLLEKCPKLIAAFMETSRLQGGTYVFRHVTEDTTIGDYRFEKGFDIIIPYQQLQVLPQHWGSDADEFNPQRFIEEPQLLIQRSSSLSATVLTSAPDGISPSTWSFPRRHRPYSIQSRDTRGSGKTGFSKDRQAKGDNCAYTRSR
jgi:cytochrome P450